ncbi:MAG: hypothetical protein OXQ28_11080 [Acidobacteriota bacterium]|nr:hypothetical protein [Acidobacteriota bacterium]
MGRQIQRRRVGRRSDVANGSFLASVLFAARSGRRSSAQVREAAPRCGKGAQIFSTRPFGFRLSSVYKNERSG